MSISKIISQIPEEEKTPLVLKLLEIIQLQAEEIQKLKDEIARLKGQKARPDIKPSNLGKKPESKKKNKGKKRRPGSDKRSKTKDIQIHNEQVIKPDIVAPGGSKLPNHRSIISADSKSNKTTASFGTSIAAAIVSAAINILIEARWDNWTNWEEINMTKWVKIIKATLLMTATETNLNREDDPLTKVEESDYSPEKFSPQERKRSGFF